MTDFINELFKVREMISIKWKRNEKGEIHEIITPLISFALSNAGEEILTRKAFLFSEVKKQLWESICEEMKKEIVNLIHKYPDDERIKNLTEFVKHGEFDKKYSPQMPNILLSLLTDDGIEAFNVWQQADDCYGRYSFRALFNKLFFDNSL